MVVLDNGLLSFENVTFLQKCLLLICISGVYLFIRGYWQYKRSWVDVPIIGSTSNPILSYLDAVKFITRGQQVVREGYMKNRGGLFKAADLKRWTVYVCSPKLVEEIKHLPDTTVSAALGADEHLKVEYTLGPTILSDDYHVRVIQNALTRNIGTVFPVMVEEMKLAFEANISVSPDKEWASVKLLDFCLRTVARTASRALVGVPMCRNEVYINFCMTYAPEAFLSASVIALFPKFMMGFAADYLTPCGKAKRRARQLLIPFINERLRLIEEHGRDWECIPNDILTWLIDEATAKERDPIPLVDRIMTINVVSMHSTSMIWNTLIKRLCACPEYIKPLREEVESIVNEHGWSKASMGKLSKMDSFVKEILRTAPGGVTTTDRIVLKDFTFSNGTFIPKGTRLSFVSEPCQTDPEVWGETAKEFDGFRFSKMRTDEGDMTKHHAIQPSTQFISFGIGRHACPGRFFAVNEIKAMTAYLILNYDFKFADTALKPGQLPTLASFGTISLPDTNTEVMFRERRK